ncbi:hypothetical protein D9Q98_006098 [Chlorella vulgaris]|uniref:non-specific serine/threonine protein kinase n=1 Tax=Chlorella vulgaris TaxID=3077 RepID=A0A9D4Z1J7_CHLVU|nr:hypothetical protein D9Q98_006098 [Chlorella vulgaris]
MSSTTAKGTASHLKKRVGKYFLGRTIGEGTYAKVKYGQHSETGQAVAVKVLAKEALVRSGMVEQIKREITILKQIRHPHIVNLLEVMSSKDCIFMVLELVTGGELFDKIVAEGPMKEPVARRVFSQLLDAVGHCHDQGVYHRDLKPENVLLCSDGTVKLSDFGLGALPSSTGVDQLLRTTCGTPNYVAPEVLAKRGYKGGPADVWSLGVLLYVLLSGCLPFDEDDLVALFAKISNARYEVPPWLSKEAVSLLACMLNPDPTQRPTVGQLWQQPWMRGGIARRGVAGWQAPPQEVQADIFAHNVEPEVIKQRYQEDNSRRLQQVQQGPRSSLRKVNAFELIKSGLDISALFEARDDVVTRRTRFSSRAELCTIMAAIENAAVAVGGRVARQNECRLRLYIPNPRGTMHVLAEVVEVLPGTRMVDLQKVQGNTVEFHKWYADLTEVLSSIISKKQPGAAGDVGVRATSARRRQQQESRGELRTNAFELISGCFNMGALFEEEEHSCRHVQFSSRRPPAAILAALQAAAAEMGGSAQVQGDKRATLAMPAGGGRVIKLHAHLFEVLAGVHVCQIAKDAGSSMDFMRSYAQLAVRLQPIMMKSNAFPTATRAAALLSTTSSMDDAQRQAIQELPRTSPAGTAEGSFFGSLHSEAGGEALFADAALTGHLTDAGLWGKSASRLSLSSVPEGTDAADRSNLHADRIARSSGDTRSYASTPAGGSPMAGSSPEAWQPLPPLSEGALGAVSHAGSGITAANGSAGVGS